MNTMDLDRDDMFDLLLKNNLLKDMNYYNRQGRFVFTFTEIGRIFIVNVRKLSVIMLVIYMKAILQLSIIYCG